MPTDCRRVVRQDVEGPLPHISGRCQDVQVDGRPRQLQIGVGNGTTRIFPRHHRVCHCLWKATSPKQWTSGGTEPYAAHPRCRRVNGANKVGLFGWVQFG